MEYLLFNESVPVRGEYDVIVAGGGPAGCTAAAASAREGARTLLIESTGMLGGMSTAGLIPTWCPFSDKQKNIYLGLAERILNSAKGASPHILPGDLDWVPIDPEALKRIYDDLLREYGAQILFHTTLSGVQTDGAGRVTSVITANKSGLSAYKAKVYIDCTGDADLAARAGAKFEHGSEDGSIMPASLCFVVSNVDEYAFSFDRRSGQRYGGTHGSNPNSIIHEIAKDDRFPLITDSHLCSKIIGPRTVGFNAGHLWQIDSTNPHDVSDAMIKGRQLAAQLHEALKLYFPSAFGASVLINTASLPGIREGRRIIGDYKMTIDDYITKRTFEDEISRNSYYIDVHMSPEEKAEAAKRGIEKASLTKRYQPGESHGIPYRSLLPRGLVNVITAGRSVSCDRQILGSVRVMPNCLCTGEAAGIAAAHAAADSGDVHSVDVNRLRGRLREEGAYFL